MRRSINSPRRRLALALVAAVLALAACTKGGTSPGASPAASSGASPAASSGGGAPAPSY